MNTCISILTLVLALGVVLSHATSEYGVVIDAGSSGSRVRIYRWQARIQEKDVPLLSEIFKYKVKPGLSSFSGNHDGILPYILQLLEQAKGQIPSGHQSTTAIYFMATAGMRLLLENEANEMMTIVDRILSNDTLNPFLYDATNTRILSGEEEGAFAWIALNFLRGFFTGETSENAGVLELGGASTQIAFVPDGSVMAGKFPIIINDREYPLYVHSYLNYGGTFTLKQAVEDLIEENPEDSTLENPCMIEGDIVQEIHGDHNITVQGTGDPEACLGIIDDFLYEVDSDFCNPKPCAIGPFYQPSVPENMTFFAIAGFVYTAEDLDQFRGDSLISDDRTASPDAIKAAAVDYCRMSLEDAVHIFGSRDFISVRCHIGLYMSTMFTKAYGFEGNTNRIKIASRIDGNPIAWPLGAIIYETQRLPVPGIAAETTVEQAHSDI